MGAGYFYSFKKDGVLDQNKYITHTPYKQLTQSIAYSEVKLNEDKYFLYKFVPRKVLVGDTEFHAHLDTNQGLFLSREMRGFDVVLPTMIFEQDNQWVNFNPIEIAQSYGQSNYYTKRYCNNSQPFGLCTGNIEYFEQIMTPHEDYFEVEIRVKFHPGVEKTKNVLTQIIAPSDYEMIYNDKVI